MALDYMGNVGKMKNVYKKAGYVDIKNKIFDKEFTKQLLDKIEI
jgi:hypothetical protein